ncbi:hypothetical protein ACERNI_15890 [Camelimonas sp. ID_303_24]
MGMGRFIGLLLVAYSMAPPGATTASAQMMPAASAICSGKQSCFMAFNGRDRGFCQAYVEGKSCFMSFSDRTDIGWCQHMREGKSCFMALDGAARADCSAGRYPPDHRRWQYLCRR